MSFGIARLKAPWLRQVGAEATSMEMQNDSCALTWAWPRSATLLVAMAIARRRYSEIGDVQLWAVDCNEGVCWILPLLGIY
jgi:hypothetical protein